MDPIPPRESQRPNPDRMREAVSAYVLAVHEAYVRQASTLPPAVQGRLPLMRPEPFSVAAVGARVLHLVATREPLGSSIAGSRGDAAFVDQVTPPLAWRLSFFDPVVLPGLGMVDERESPAFEEVRRLLGIRTHLYHVTLTPPAELAVHRAGHTGAALAGAHTAAARDYDSMRAAAGARDAGLVDEFEGAELAGLPRAASLLARELAPDDPEVARLASRERDVATDHREELRRAVLRAVRERRWGGDAASDVVSDAATGDAPRAARAGR